MEQLSGIREVVRSMDDLYRTGPPWTNPQVVETAMEAARNAHFEFEQPLIGADGVMTSLQKAQIAQADALQAMKQAVQAIPTPGSALESFLAAYQELTKVSTNDREEKIRGDKEKILLLKENFLLEEEIARNPETD
jgi:hypothetical protein